jgi:hypothetical protein
VLPYRNAAFVAALHSAVCSCCRGSEVYDAARSASNPAEAQAVRRLVRLLVDHGVPRSDIGIICFFHAQVCSCVCIWISHCTMCQPHTVLKAGPAIWCCLQVSRLAELTMQTVIGNPAPGVKPTDMPTVPRIDQDRCFWSCCAGALHTGHAGRADQRQRLSRWRGRRRGAGGCGAQRGAGFHRGQLSGEHVKMAKLSR